MPETRKKSSEPLASPIINPRELESKDFELVFALVGAVGTNLKYIEDALCDCLGEFNYTVPARIHLSDFLKNVVLSRDGKRLRLHDTPEDKRIESRMDAGNLLREETGLGEVLALLAIQRISEARNNLIGRNAYVINSVKHPSEVHSLRRIYGPGFFLIAAHSPEEVREIRLANLIAESNNTTEVNRFISAARNLIRRDEFEPGKFGQQVREAFHLADVFVSLTGDSPAAKNSAKESLKRFLRLIMGDPFQTPTADEYLMFHAHAAAMRSGSLSRQVGAVIGTDRAEVLSVGCNDVPRAGGGLYLAGDVDDNRDMKRERDSSDEQKEKMVDELLELLRSAGWLNKKGKKGAAEAIVLLRGTRLMNVIEFGRDAHAEMEAILAAARMGISIKGHDLYSTTFPCHNCAKLIIAAGINRVVYIEPYPKSLAIELHGDSISIGEKRQPQRKAAPPVLFEPFVGVGPRRYLEFFSLGQIKRKDESGRPVKWDGQTAMPRIPLLPLSYLERETQAKAIISKIDILNKL